MFVEPLDHLASRIIVELRAADDGKLPQRENVIDGKRLANGNCLGGILRVV